MSNVAPFLHSQHYSDEELTLVQRLPVPKHVAVIPDGNRRWAQQTPMFDLMHGHWVGASVLTTVLEAASEIGIKTLTVYSFSTENWKRSSQEITTLLSIFEAYLRENRSKMIEKGVRFGTIGDLEPFPQSIKDEVARTQEATCKGEVIDLVLAMNYGARDEIRRALLSMVHDIEAGTLDKGQVTERTITEYLDTASYGDPELLIRTSGERRFSNFLLWQLAYTEVYIAEVLWPNFTPRDLLNAVLDFQNRTRRLGK